MPYCGYIDILGTKGLASRDISDLRDHMEWFHTSLYDFYSFYKGKCIAASDGAFYENENINDFFSYFKRLRNFLFDKGVFFKCSYIKGTIDVLMEVVPDDNSEIPKFLSLNFSNQASDAFRAESKLKGIGCSIDGLSKTELPDGWVSNFYLAFDGRKITPIRFIDFSFSEYEISDGEQPPDWPGQRQILERILYYMRLTAMESDYVFAKYIPLLVNAIRSSGFTGVKMGDKSWERAPYILRKIISPRSPFSSFSKNPGIRYVILALYDATYQGNSGEIDKKSEDAIISFIARRWDCKKNLNDVPDFVLCHRAKKRLMQKLAE